MDEEELQLLEQAAFGVEGEQISAASPERLQELTDDIARSAPVVNRAREGRGRLQGITNFLENPEVQEALLAFGRAFAAPRGEAAGEIAQGFESIMQRRGTQAALEAAESGDPIAEAAGGWADPALVSQLQERRQLSNLAQQRLDLDEREFAQRVAEFDIQVGFDERMMQLREAGFEHDTVLDLARLSLDQEKFETRVEQLEREHELNQRIAESEIAYREFLMSQEAQQTENFALRTNEFIGLLNEQEQVLRSELNTIQRALEDFDDMWEWTNVAGFRDRPGAPRVRDATREAQLRGEEIAPPGRGPQAREALQRAYDRAQTKLGSTRAQIESLQASQAARLGGTPLQEGETPPQQEPIVVNSPAQLQEQAAGSPVGTRIRFGTLTYEVLENGIRPVTE